MNHAKKNRLPFYIGISVILLLFFYDLEYIF